MAATTPVPVPVEITSPVFEAIKGWPSEDEFVPRVLAGDVPQRVAFGFGRVWVYEDAEKNLVAFGTLDICEDYADLTGGRPHPYIPLLAVHPDQRGRGYGKAVLDHLVDEAACAARDLADLLEPVLFLDVYEDSAAAYKMYLKRGFVDLTPGGLVDPANGKRYRVMAIRPL